MNIFTEAAKLEEQNCPFAMAQIVDSRGSTPRHSAQMLVRADGSIVGTIGGGMVERKVIEESLQALQERKPRLFHGRMARNGADAVGSDCGGAMGNDSNLLIVFYVQIMPDDLVMQLHRF